MIGIEGTVRVLVAAKPVDFRKGMDGLAALVQQQLGADPSAAASTSSAPNEPIG